jgi:branched-chain amino acid transport system substrate-binding protein
MRTKQTRGTLAVVALAVAALGVSACSSSSSSGGSSVSANNPKLTKSTIVIGMLNASTGAADGAQTKPSEDVAKAWETWVNNDRGGINGHPVKVVLGDSKDDPATAATVAKQMISDKVIAEVGGTDSVTDGVWIPEFTNAKVPVIGGLIVEDQVITSSPYMYSLTIPVSKLLTLMIDTAKTAGASSFAGVLCAESPSCAGATQIWKPRASQQGIEWDGYTQVLASASNYTAACLNVQQSKADFVELAVSSPTAIRVVNNCQQQHIDPKLYGVSYGTLNGPRLVPVSKQGADFLGVIAGFPWFLNTPAVKQYRDVMSKYSPDHTYTQDEIQSDAWAGLEMFRKAMANAGDNPTAADVATAMSNVKNEDLDGLLPQKVSFTAGKPSTPLNCLYRVKLSKGTFSDGAVQCLTN